MNLTGPFSLALAAIVALSLLGLPVGHAMIGGSILYLFLANLDMGTAAEQLLNGMNTSFLLLAIPLFVLAAEFMNTGSIMDRLLRFCNAIVGRFRGGLAQVNVVQSIIFASMSGSALADAAGSGKLMQSLMTRDGKYPPAYAAALTAASSVIGPILPPSIPLVLYALVSDTSVGYLFLGGVVPGLLIGVVQSGLIAFTAKRRNFPVEARVPLRELPRITWEAFPALMMPVILLGCLYSGITTPTEAAGVAAAYALLVSVVLYRNVGWKDVYQSLVTSLPFRRRANAASIIRGRPAPRVRAHSMHVIFEDDGQLKAGTVLADHDASLQIEAASGKRLKIKAGNVLLRFPAPSPGETLAAAAKLAGEIDPTFLWEVSGEAEFGFDELARDYYGANATPPQQAAVALRLHGAPMHFYKRGKGRYRKAPEPALKAALASVERKQREAAQIDEWVGMLRRRELPQALRPKLAMLLYRPDKNALEWKALSAACDAERMQPRRAARRLRRDCFVARVPLRPLPRRGVSEGRRVPGVGELPPLPDLPLADVRAFSVDDRHDDRDRRRVLGSGACKRQRRDRHPHRRTRRFRCRAAASSMRSRASDCRPCTCPGGRSRCFPTTRSLRSRSTRGARVPRCRCTSRRRMTACRCAARRASIASTLSRTCAWTSRRSVPRRCSVAGGSASEQFRALWCGGTGSRAPRGWPRSWGGRRRPPAPGRRARRRRSAAGAP